MDGKNIIKFLGTAGARFVVAKQLRFSAGTFIRMKGKSIILDPGPGTLIRCAKSRPSIDVSKIDAIILTHGHIDHGNDVNIMIDAMTEGGLKKRGWLFAPGECIYGPNAVIFNYLRGYPKEVNVLEPARDYKIGDLVFSTSLKHEHPVETYGIIFNLDGRKVGFMVDTKYFPELARSYEGTDILVINLVRHTAHKSGDVMHLCLEDVKNLLPVIGPKRVVLTHFGMTILKAKPWEIADHLGRELGIEIIAASDGMTLELD